MATILYRPVGLTELALIFDTRMRAFPPRLPEQPIFYPVLNQEYASHIALQWNAPSRQCGFAGYVTRFAIHDHYAEQYPVQTVGASVHQELWVPADRVDEFNRHIVGEIQVSASFFGDSYADFVPTDPRLHARNASEHLRALNSALDTSDRAFIDALVAGKFAVYANFPFWHGQVASAATPRVVDAVRVLNAIQVHWRRLFPEITLPSFNQTAGAS